MVWSVELRALKCHTATTSSIAASPPSLVQPPPAQLPHCRHQHYSHTVFDHWYSQHRTSTTATLPRAAVAAAGLGSFFPRSFLVFLPLFSLVCPCSLGSGRVSCTLGCRVDNVTTAKLTELPPRPPPLPCHLPLPFSAPPLPPCTVCC